MLGYGQQAGGTHPTGMPSCKLIYSAIHKAASRHSSWLEPPPGAVPAAGSIHGLWEFQELYQAKSWNGWEP